MKRLNVLLFSLDPILENLLVFKMNDMGFNLYSTNNFYTFWGFFYKKDINLIIIDDKDIHKNDIFNLCKTIRFFSNPKIIVLSNKFSKNLDFKNLDIDFLFKPFSMNELGNKILFNLDLTEAYSNIKKRNKLIIYNNLSKIKINSKIISLTKTQFNLFNFLILKKKQIAKKSEILENLWGYTDSWSLESNIIEVHLSKLREKIQKTTEKRFFFTKKKSYFLLSKKKV